MDRERLRQTSQQHFITEYFCQFGIRPRKYPAIARPVEARSPLEIIGSLDTNDGFVLVSDLNQRMNSLIHLVLAPILAIGSPLYMSRQYGIVYFKDGSIMCEYGIGWRTVV